jgi:hypothetical protein
MVLAELQRLHSCWAPGPRPGCGDQRLDPLVLLVRARQLMTSVVYLSVYPELPAAALDTLLRVLAQANHLPVSPKV